MKRKVRPIIRPFVVIAVSAIMIGLSIPNMFVHVAGSLIEVF